MVADGWNNPFAGSSPWRESRTVFPFQVIPSRFGKMRARLMPAARWQLIPGGKIGSATAGFVLGGRRRNRVHRVKRRVAGTSGKIRSKNLCRLATRRRPLWEKFNVTHSGWVLSRAEMELMAQPASEVSLTNHSHLLEKENSMRFGIYLDWQQTKLDRHCGNSREEVRWL